MTTDSLGLNKSTCQHSSYYYFAMIRLGLQLVLLVFVMCSYGCKDFPSLGRHSWRCKRRTMDNEPEISHKSRCLIVDERAVIANSQEISCYSGKKCKGMKGLKMH